MKKKTKRIISLLTIIVIAILLEILERIADKLFFNGDGQLAFLKLNYIISAIQTLVILIALFYIFYLLYNKLLSKRIADFSLIIAGILIPIISLEVFLNLVNRPRAGRDNYIYAGWKLLFDHEKINDVGFRGQDIDYTDSSIVILLLGDSQVEAKACSFSEMPEQVLENKLKKINGNIKVFSLGSSGYGTDQEYLALKEYFKSFRADHVILWQTIDNDIWNNIFPSHNLPRDGIMKPTFWLNEKGNLKGPNYQPGDKISYLGNISNAGFKIILLLNRVIYRHNYHPEIGVDASWEKYLPESYHPLMHYDGEYNTDWDPNFNKSNPFIAGENLD